MKFQKARLWEGKMSILIYFCMPTSRVLKLAFTKYSVEIAFKSCPKRYIKSTPIFMTIHSPSLATDSVFCACEKRRKTKKTELLLKLPQSQRRLTRAATCTVWNVCFWQLYCKTKFNSGCKNRQGRDIWHKHGCICCFCFCKRPQSRLGAPAVHD